MSETPKYQNTFHFNQGLGNVNAGDVTNQRDQVGIQHNYAPEQKQSLAEAAKEIQELFYQLSQTYPTTTETQKQVAIIEKVQQHIKCNHSLRNRLWNALKSGGIEALKQALDAIYENPLVIISVETIKGFLEAEYRE